MLIVTIIALEVGIALYDHNLSLDTIYFAAILICIVLLLVHVFLRRKRDEKNSSFILAIYFTIYCFFAVISYIRIGYVSVPGIIGFSCFVTYGGFVFISILKRKSKN